MDILLLRKGDKPAIDWSFLGALPSGAEFLRASTAWGFDANGNKTAYADNVPKQARRKGTGELLGLYLETGSSSNKFLNNELPVTQDITTTAAHHTLTFYGSGSIALSGSYNGTLNGVDANTQSRLTFYANAGALTLTLSGEVVFPELKVGRVPTSLIITGGTSVSRAAESLIFPSIPWFNPAEGTFLCEFIAEYETSSSTWPRIVSFNDGSTANEISLFRSPTNSIKMACTNGGVAVVDTGTVPYVEGAVNKSVVRYKTNDFRHAMNGVLGTPDASAALPTITRLEFGKVNTTYSGGIILRRFKYWNRALSDAEMARLST